MGQRVAIIDGCRTPFVKAWTDFINLTSLDLAKIATSELINKTELDPDDATEIHDEYDIEVSSQTPELRKA